MHRGLIYLVDTVNKPTLTDPGVRVACTRVHGPGRPNGLGLSLGWDLDYTRKGPLPGSGLLSSTDFWFPGPNTYLNRMKPDSR